MNQNNKPNHVDTSPAYVDGLSLSGTVIDRVKRMIPRENPTTEIVTYTIQDGSNHKFYVDDYAPKSYHNINTSVSLSVYIKTYIKKNGDASYTLNIQKNKDSRGIHF